MISTMGCQIPSIPRKGTETLHLLLEICPFFYFVRYPQFPARGRKRRNSSGALEIWSKSSQIPSIPRKGTETPFSGFLFPNKFSRVRYPQFPARGRKHGGSEYPTRHAGTVRYPQFPARGRKLGAGC